MKRKRRDFIALTRAAVEELLRFDPATFKLYIFLLAYEWCEADPPKIPHVRIGRTIRFDRDELLAWIDSHRVAAS